MKNKKVFILLLLIPIIIFFIGRSFSLPYTEEIKSVEIQSVDYPNPGSWHIDKSAEWTGFGKARVTFDLNSVINVKEGQYKDVILVIDISGSMFGDKLTRAKNDAIELTNFLLSDTHNSMALIVFSDDSEIKTGFINDKDTMIGLLSDLTEGGNTNYNKALKNVNIVMNNYVQKDDTDIVTLFLTDGFPNEDTPNEVATYHMLKDKYPYMTINGIQYEMGIDIIREIINISDNQWLADMNTLHNVLFDATVVSIIYDNFVITDYINDEYFYVNSIDDIKVDRGEVSMEVENGIQKIIWNIGNKYKTGENIKMSIDLNLKEEYHETNGLYPTNKDESIISKLHEGVEKVVDSTLTPVLKNAYYVIYDKNTPTDCNLPSIASEEHYVYQNVTKKQDVLSCPGYVFKGWVIDENDKVDTKFINDDSFVMPEHDITFRATWIKQSLIKNTNGVVVEKSTLYRVLQKEAKNGIYAKEYKGEHQDSFDNTGNKKIYHWYANDATDANEILNRNNVVFANQCWKMYRTTDTGGVKLLYYGEAVDKQCLSTRGTHFGFAGTSTTTDLSGKFSYGTDYIYDKDNRTFKLTGDIILSTINSTNAQNEINNLIGMYTCKKQSAEDTCGLIYLIDGYSNSTKAFDIPMNSNASYSTLGKIVYNGSSSSQTTISDVGYMYNESYPRGEKYNNFSFSSSCSISNSYYLSDQITYGTIVEDNYSLVNPQLKSTLSSSELVGKYMLSNGKNGATPTAKYIYKISGSTPYCITIRNGALSPNFMSGYSYKKNSDGTYTINYPTRQSYVTWASSSGTAYKGKYICEGDNDTCKHLIHISDGGIANIYYRYVSVDTSYKFGESVEYKDGIYTLTGDIQDIWDVINSNERNKINSHHYTCFSDEISCSDVKYVYNYNNFNGPTFVYVTLSNVDNIESAINNMLKRNDDEYKLNAKDSRIKKAIELWYEKTIYDNFDSYIEDTIYCNDRSIFELNGWDSQNGNIYNTGLTHNGYNAIQNLKCPNEVDSFSTLNSEARLKYKIGMATRPELEIVGYRNLKAFGNDSSYYYLMTPFSAGSSARVDQYGNISSSGSETNIRPVISLRPDIEYVSGDGSLEHPYLVDDGTN